MCNIQDIELNRQTREECLPGYSTEFPYIATCAELDKYEVSWHWHKPVELFYIESGALEYETPNGKSPFLLVLEGWSIPTYSIKPEC